MYCRLCGTENANEYKFCRHCGKPLEFEMEGDSSSNERIELKRDPIPNEIPHETNVEEPVPAMSNEITEDIDDSNIRCLFRKKIEEFGTTNLLLIAVIGILSAMFVVLAVYLIIYLRKEPDDSIKAAVIEEIDFENSNSLDDIQEETDTDNETIAYEDDYQEYVTDNEGTDDNEPEYSEIEEYEEGNIESTSNDSEFLLPNSSDDLISMYELNGFSKEECRIARNEIYARHGRMFKDNELQAYFNSKPWYEGYIDPDVFSESVLSKIELENIKTITEYEKSKGYR